MNVAVLTREGTHAEGLTKIGCNALDELELRPIARERFRQIGGLGLQDWHRLGRLLAAEHVSAALDDARLGGRNLGNRVAQALCVVHRNWRKYGHIAIGDVGRVPLATHADLKHEHVDRGIREDREAKHGKRLEECQSGVTLGLELRVDDLDERLDLLPDGVQALVADRLAVDRHALVQANEVRAGEATGAQAMLAQDAFDEASGRGLAVSAGHVNDAVGLLRVAEQFDGSAGWLEARAQLVLRDSGNQVVFNRAGTGGPLVIRVFLAELRLVLVDVDRLLVVEYCRLRTFGAFLGLEVQVVFALEIAQSLVTTISTNWPSPTATCDALASVVASSSESVSLFTNSA